MSAGSGAGVCPLVRSRGDDSHWTTLRSTIKCLCEQNSTHARVFNGDLELCYKISERFGADVGQRGLRSLEGQ
ncbi:hypothetical protein RRG08_004143 [Elysia crispata]|uniref:Uncharacterized protein n=1 Tax=Elysia crispata TaxID=231223 RepID=A0AAE0YY10_9GAST|nr:hypothetical protein RRG08_004143 [Elysia crispata]